MRLPDTTSNADTNTTPAEAPPALSERIANTATADKLKIKNPKSKIVWAALVLTLTAPFLFRSLAGAQNTGPTPMPMPYAYIPSPNFNERPITSTVSAVVVHATVEPTTEGTIGIFLNPRTQVSAHFVVGRDGRVVQMVPVEKRAWHAGVSTLEGLGDLNNFSVGIEMVNLNDGKDPYPEAQYQAVAGIIRFLRSRYNIPDSRIVSHEEIALPPGRKNDPVGFSFDKLKLLARTDAQGQPLAGPYFPVSTVVPPVTDPTKQYQPKPAGPALPPANPPANPAPAPPKSDIPPAKF